MKFLEQTPSPRVAFLVAGMLVVVWGTTWAAIRISLEGLAPLLSMSLRFALASLVLMALARKLRVPLRAPGRNGWILLWSQTLGAFGLAYSVVYWAEQWVPSGLAAVLFATLPLFVALLTLVALPSEKLGWPVWLGVLIGFAGVMVIFSEDLAALAGEEVRLAAVVLLVSPFAAACSQVAIKRWGNEVHSLTLSALPMLCSAVLMLAISSVFESDRAFAPTLQTWLAVLYLGLIGSAFTFTLYFWLLTRGNVLRVSLIAYGTPVVAVGVGTWLLDEPLTLRLVLGALLVLAGVAAVVRPHRTA